MFRWVCVSGCVLIWFVFVLSFFDFVSVFCLGLYLCFWLVLRLDLVCFRLLFRCFFLLVLVFVVGFVVRFLFSFAFLFVFSLCLYWCLWLWLGLLLGFCFRLYL